jgi:cytochrome oxidase Cu insertion factor (SCO1/SenC/PrrC family)
VATFGRFDAAHGWAVNLFVVVVLAGLGAAFLTGRPAVGRWAAVVGAVVALADWVLVQDLGFVGGPGVGLGSMLPMAALLAAAGLALSRSAHPAPAPALGAADGRAAPPPPAPGVRWRPAAAAGAMAVAVASLVPMTATAAATLPAPAVVVSPGRGPAPGFDLVDQYGHRVTAASLRGKAVALAFLGPVCTVDCPVIAQEMRAADGALGAVSHRVDLVAVNTDPQYTGRAYLLTFDRREGMAAVPNWLYLTASVPQLEHLWAAFGAQAEYGTGGASAAESDVAYVIGPDGDLRYALGQGQAEGPGGGSFASALAAALRHALGSSAK